MWNYDYLEGNVIISHSLNELRKKLKNKRVKLVINVDASLEKEKYIEQTKVCLDTWINFCPQEEVPIIFSLGDFYNKDFLHINALNFLNAGEDYASCYFKNLYGLKWLFKNIDADFYLNCDTDSFIHVPRMLEMLNNYDRNEDLYLGNFKMYSDTGLRKYIPTEKTFTCSFDPNEKGIFQVHSGGSGYIISKSLSIKLSPLMNKITYEWLNIIEGGYKYLCDVTIPFYINKYFPNTKTIRIDNMSNVNHFGSSYGNIINKGSYAPVMDLQKLITCHWMDPPSMIEVYTNYLPNNLLTIVTFSFEEDSAILPMLDWDQNMIIFCDNYSYINIWKIRKEKNLLHKTFLFLIKKSSRNNCISMLWEARKNDPFNDYNYLFVDPLYQLKEENLPKKFSPGIGINLLHDTVTDDILFCNKHNLVLLYNKILKEIAYLNQELEKIYRENPQLFFRLDVSYNRIITSDISNIIAAGNFGNQLFEIAFTYSVALKNGGKCYFPFWDYEEYFINRLPYGKISHKINIREDPRVYKDIFLEENTIYNTVGYWQWEEYFNHCEKDIRQLFKLKKEILAYVSREVPEILQPHSIVIHVRRGDYLGLKSFHQCTLNYFVKTQEYIQREYGKGPIIVCSDDIDWCKQNLHNVIFSPYTKIHEIKIPSKICDFALMILAQHHICANSSFSWWGAWLSERENKTIFFPSLYFTPGLELDGVNKNIFSIGTVIGIRGEETEKYLKKHKAKNYLLL